MVWAPQGATRLPGGALRVGAVLAASGPVLLKTSGITLAELTVGVCHGVTGSGPVLATVTPWGRLLSWAELLLPVLLSVLLLTTPRRTTPSRTPPGTTPRTSPDTTADTRPHASPGMPRGLPSGTASRTVLGVAAVSVVLVLRLLSVALPPVTRSPVTGRFLPVSEPWPAVACYAVAVVALLLAARSPVAGSRPGTAVLWAAAMAACAWTPARLSLQDATAFGWVASTTPTEVLWREPWGWSCKAEVDGVLVVLVALAAVGGTALTDRARLGLALATGALLVLAAVVTVALVLVHGSGDLLAMAMPYVQWHLIAAAALVAAAATAARTRPPA
uniref:hypothetical protein n=1 Tax=Nonomuraea pusilla TaxID=46177 RepID=UPI0006E1C34B|nr:hypothetical protein [Nonomuraea pusilla]